MPKEKNNMQSYLLAAVCAIALAAVAIGGMNAMGFSTAATGTASATVASSVAITMTTSTVAFGSLAQLASNDTLGSNPAPFVVQNDGNVYVNLTINASNLFATAANPTSNFQYFANLSSEGTCFVTAESVSTWTNLPDNATNTVFMKRLNFPASCDTGEIEIKVTVPTDESTGAKSSSVTVVASEA